MLKRTLTALLLIPPVIYLIGWSPEWLLLLAIIVAVVLALREYFALSRAMGLKVFASIGYPGAIAFCLVQTPVGRSAASVSLALVLALVLLIPTMAMPRDIGLKDLLAAASATLFGVLYIGLTLSCLVPIRFSLYPFGRFSLREAGVRHGLGTGSSLLLFLFVVIWAGDICAYLVGRSMGRVPFFARISPRKTWEGALAGLAGSLLAAWAFAHWTWRAGGGKAAILLAAWIAVAGQTGDLVESAIKRGANQKDSGALLPGHGGFLDRIDSLLFAAPAVWLALQAIGCFS